MQVESWLEERGCRAMGGGAGDLKDAGFFGPDPKMFLLGGSTYACTFYLTIYLSIYQTDYLIDYVIDYRIDMN